MRSSLVGTPSWNRTRGGWPTVELDRWLVSKLPLRGIPVEIRLSNGLVHRFSDAPPIAVLHIADRLTLARLLLNPDVAFGEAYRRGRVEVEGDFAGLLEGVFRRRDPLEGRARHRWRSLASGNTLSRSRHNVHRHYDLGNDFYRRWLDRELVYTCAYFPSPDDTLETAQEAKMRLVCRKLRLKPGERVVEAGCGWGALALFMARHYGVQVKAFNLSHEQITFARERARREDLAGRVEFIEDDYRTIAGTYDVFVSVGMLEHVGPAHYSMLGASINRSLTPDGRGLLHFIGRNRPRPLNAWIRRRVFPGAYPPALDEVFHTVLEPWDLSVLDVENLRLHYGLTLKHWRQRFEDHAAEVRAMYDEPFVRTWRLYLTCSEAAFRSGWLQLFQVVFARGRSNQIPWRRDQ